MKSDYLYEPAEDSFLLEEYVKKFANGTVLDIGTGSAIQAKTAASLKKVKSVVAVDISEHVVLYLKKQKLNKKITIKKSDLFSNVKGRFDVITFNPPYLPLDPREPEDSRWATTGGKHGYETLKRFLYDLDDHLNKNGFALILFSSLTKKLKVDEFIQDIGYESQLLAERPIGGFETLFVYKIKRNWLLEKLFDKKVTNVKKLTRGNRGVIFIGKYKNKKVAIKSQRPDVPSKTIDREAKMIALLNKKSITPKLIFKDSNYFVYDFAEGEFIIDFLKHSKKQETKKVLLEVMRQCRILDLMNISKEEMHNPYKHVIVGKKIVLIDFERARKNEYPQNVTQFCQYIWRNYDVLSSKGIKFKKDDLMNLTKQYKHNQTESNYKKIKSFIFAF